MLGTGVTYTIEGSLPPGTIQGSCDSTIIEQGHSSGGHKRQSSGSAVGEEVRKGCRDKVLVLSLKDESKFPSILRGVVESTKMAFHKC